MNYINYYQRNNAAYISFIFITKHVNNYYFVTIFQGTRIQVVLFSDAVDIFDNKFVKENTYFISNDLVKQVNTNLSNVHDKLELVLSTYTRVEEAQISIDIPNSIYNFL